jgi:hypothetical protein
VAARVRIPYGLPRIPGRGIHASGAFDGVHLTDIPVRASCGVGTRARLRDVGKGKS